MTISNLDFYKNKLEQERMRVEHELSKIAERNPENPDDWRMKGVEGRPDSADVSELADQFEEMGTQASISSALEARLISIKKALDKIAKGEYGNCEECGKSIDQKRLDANPAALTCVEHTD